MERQYQDWISYEYFPNHNLRKRVEGMAPVLTLKDVRCSGIDTVANKMLYLAEKKGTYNLNGYQVKGSSRAANWEFLCMWLANVKK